MSHHRPSFVPAVLLLLLVACRETPIPPPEVAFEQMVSGVQSRALDASDTLAVPTGALVRGRELIVIDEARAEAKVYDRQSGAVVRMVGRPGDGDGDLRAPVAIAPLDSGRYVIYDYLRRLISVRDSLGRTLRESPILKGDFNSILAFPEEQRVILAGPTLRAIDGANGMDLHEFDYAGKLRASYAKTVRPPSGWARRIAAIATARMGSTVIMGAMNSNRLRMYDRRTGTVRWLEAAPGWYRPIAWPSDAILQHGASRQTAAQILRNWMYTQRLLSGVYPLTHGRLLVRFLAFAPDHSRLFHYAVMDTTGRTFAVSRATRAQVLVVVADTAMWVSGAGSRDAWLGSGVVTVGLPETPHAVASAPPAVIGRSPAAR